MLLAVADSTIQTVGVALIAAVVGPAVLAVITGRQRGKEKEQDWARQDEVAARVAAVSEKLIQTTRTTDDKLDVIHTLVNSNMTAAMESELGATERELAMMKEVVGLKRVQGHEPTPEASAAIDATTARVVELQAQLDDRKQAQTAIDAG